MSLGEESSSKHCLTEIAQQGMLKGFQNTKWMSKE